VERLVFAHQKFLKSLNALERSLNFSLKYSASAETDELENSVASLIKHFEICYEMCWKFFQQYIKKFHSIELASPKAIFRECFVLKIINQEETKKLLDISEARNATTHDYNEETARELCSRISEYFITLKSLERITIDT
jgi:nucleotidyltransferase substrate binding protein (TIGR01987 family)